MSDDYSKTPKLSLVSGDEYYLDLLQKLEDLGDLGLSEFDVNGLPSKDWQRRVLISIELQRFMDQHFSDRVNENVKSELRVIQSK